MRTLSANKNEKTLSFLVIFPFLHALVRSITLVLGQFHPISHNDVATAQGFLMGVPSWSTTPSMHPWKL
jgi:hypothetical protein